jgi:hypothetical protein
MPARARARDAGSFKEIEVKRISVTMTPKEYARVRVLANAWAKDTSQRRFGKGFVAAFVRELLLRELMGGTK